MDIEDGYEGDDSDGGLDLHISTTPLKREAPVAKTSASGSENKRARSIQGPNAEGNGDDQQGRLESFRHLFSFGAKSGSDAGAAVGGIVKTARTSVAAGAVKNERGDTKVPVGFSLLGQAQVDSEPNGRKIQPHQNDENEPVHVNSARAKTSEKMRNRDVDMTEVDQKEEEKKDGGDDEGESDEKRSAAIASEHPLLITNVCDRAFVDMLASRFFEEDGDKKRLARQWNDLDGGLREEMRADFKQKRQNIMRGRKLGAGRKDVVQPLPER